MKRIFQCYFILLACFPAALSAELTKPIDILNAMMTAHKNINYELHYILQQEGEIESLRYRHAVENNREFAQLLRLDNAKEMIILKENTVSYLGRMFQPFSLRSPHILDNLPSVFHTNFSQLEGYDFVPLGKSRVADRVANVMRIIPMDNSRYSYTLWVDEENYLLLKSELYDENNNMLEQFRVIEQHIDREMNEMIPSIEQLNLPPFVELTEDKPSFPWQITWLPQGFSVLTERRLNLSDNSQVESRQYSDGLFTFTVYVFPNDEQLLSDVLWKQRKLTVFTHKVNKRNVAIIGDIPVNTARKIANSIQFPEVEK